MDEKTVKKIGWFASIMAILMYFSYIDQIMLNISGRPGSVILPFVTTINCTLWTIYGLSSKEKNWPIVACNFPGIFLGLITALTAIMY